MTIDDKLTKEKNTKEGLDLVDKIPSNNMLKMLSRNLRLFKRRYKQTEEHLMIAGNTTSTYCLTKMYEQSAVYSETTQE